MVRSHHRPLEFSFVETRRDDNLPSYRKVTRMNQRMLHIKIRLLLYNIYRGRCLSGEPHLFLLSRSSSMDTTCHEPLGGLDSTLPPSELLGNCTCLTKLPKDSCCSSSTIINGGARRWLDIRSSLCQGHSWLRLEYGLLLLILRWAPTFSSFVSF